MCSKNGDSARYDRRVGEVKVLSLEPKKGLSCFQYTGRSPTAMLWTTARRIGGVLVKKGGGRPPPPAPKRGWLGNLLPPESPARRASLWTLFLSSPIPFYFVFNLTTLVLICGHAVLEWLARHIRSYTTGKSSLQSTVSCVESSSPQSLNVCALDNSFRCRSYVCCCLLISVSFDYLLTYRKTLSSQSEARSRESSTLTERGCLPP